MASFGDMMLSFLLETLFTVGVIGIFGFLIALLNRVFYTNFGRNAMIACYITGAIGTPVHECAHALFCLIFGHKIEEIKLFQIGGDGTLGYVNHSYNRKNVYHVIGNFFIGIAPIIVITALLYLIAWPLVPGMLNSIMTAVSALDVSKGYENVFVTFGSVIGAIFSHAGDFRWWIFIFISIFFCIHMTLSGADIKNALGGLGMLLGVLLIVNIVLGLIGKPVLSAFTNGIISAGCYLASFLLLSLIVVIIAVLVTLPFRFIKRR